MTLGLPLGYLASILSLPQPVSKAQSDAETKSVRNGEKGNSMGLDNNMLFFGVGTRPGAQKQGNMPGRKVNRNPIATDPAFADFAYYPKAMMHLQTQTKPGETGVP